MAQLSITRNGRLEGVFYLPDRPIVVGRADGVDIQLLDSRVSRRHSVIRQSVAGFMIQNLNTKNGTYVNKEAIEKSLLFHGDTIVIGGYTLHFLEEDGVEDLDSGDISALKDSERALKVPSALSDPVNPRTRTKADPGRPPPAPVNRLDRAPKKPPKPRRRPPRLKESNTQVPVIEADAVDDSSAPLEEPRKRLSDFSEIEIVLDDDPEPRPSGRPPTTVGLPRKALQELVQHVHETDTPRVEELSPGGASFLVNKGTTTLGTTGREDVKVGGGALFKGLLATLERDGSVVRIRPESVLRTVRVNGARITDPTQLTPGDVFELSGRQFAFGRNQLDADRRRELIEKGVKITR